MAHLHCLHCIVLAYQHAAFCLYSSQLCLLHYLHCTGFGHQHPAYCMHSSQASHLLFELFFHTGCFSVICLHNCMLPTTCLLFYHLLLEHPEFLYPACLTMLGHILALQKKLIAFVFLYALVLSNKFLAASLLLYCMFLI